MIIIYLKLNRRYILIYMDIEIKKKKFLHESDINCPNKQSKKFTIMVWI
jgi:hypothetical protein